MTAHTTATLATALDTTPRELRKFLRASSQGVGKGSRYALDLNARDIAKLRKGFDDWAAARAAARNAIEDATETPESDASPE